MDDPDPGHAEPVTEPYAPPPPALPDAPAARRSRRVVVVAVAAAVIAMLAVGAVLAVVVRTASGQGYDDLADLSAFRPVPKPSETLRSVDSLPVDEAVAYINSDVQQFWDRQFQEGGSTYSPAGLTLFTSGQVATACGPGEEATGPFYCGADRTVYLAPTFFRQLSTQFQAPGDFAAAYVIAHEVGHHVQNLLGISSQVQTYVQANPEDANPVSVLTELQADCFAGVWAASTRERGLLEEGDVEEGLRAAAAVGDDVLQRRSQGAVTPEAFTHGTAEQRTEWFSRGFDSGDMTRCDTFAEDDV